MNRKILGIVAALALVAGCDLATKTDWEGPVAACKPAGPTLAACVENSECCSYACISGICAAGETPGAVCSTTNDCAATLPTYPYQMLCKGGHCANPLPYCRDLADVCSLDSQCCGGNRCTASRCTLNRPPVIDLGVNPVNNVPRRQQLTQNVTTSDPDGDALVHTWNWVSRPPGSAASIQNTSVQDPTFTPDLEGTYVLRLVLTDQPAPSMTATADLIVIVINTPPTVTPQADVADWRRNNHVPAQITAVVNDRDGDDITCTWVVKDPGGATRSTVGPTACFGTTLVPDDVTTTVPFPTNLVPVDEGVWTVTISATDGNSTTSADVHVNVTNDLPAPAVTRSPYYANLAAIPANTAAVVLDASPSTDLNGDHLLIPGLSYFWEWVSVTDGGALPTLTGFDTATPSFTATRAADYILRVTVTDPPSSTRAGASTPLLVTVKVGRYIRPLAHDVIDSAYAKTANKLVMAGHDPANAARGMLWVLDAATEAEGAGILLADTAVVPNVYGVPKYLGVTPDGTKAVVVDTNVSIWFVTLGATPTVTRAVAPFTIQDLVVATNRWAYIFNVTWDFTLGAFQEIDLNNRSMSVAPWSGYEGYGAAASSGTSNYIYRVETDFGSVDKFPIGNNGSSNTILASGSATCGGYPGTTASEIWPVIADTFVVSSCGTVYRASDLSIVAGKTLGAPSHMDSTASLAVAASGSTVTNYDATLDQPVTETVPAWAENYYGRTASISKVWLNSSGTKRFALVDDTASPKRYGLVTFP